VCAPPGNACPNFGAKCVNDGNCCPGIVCNAGHCAQPDPSCQSPGMACLTTEDCCADPQSAIGCNGICVSNVGGTSCSQQYEPCFSDADCCGGLDLHCKTVEYDMATYQQCLPPPPPAP
jgi:hypothetical protein